MGRGNHTGSDLLDEREEVAANDATTGTICSVSEARLDD
jgi:hypothetical protein